MRETPDVRFEDRSTLSRDEIIDHIRDKLLAARDDVAGIILFGSFARGEAWHDIDVLVVLRERIPTRKVWAAIMRECQDAIGLYNLDLIPTHLGGLRQGLAEHVFILMVDGSARPRAQYLDLRRSMMPEFGITGENHPE